jgi:uncharacterized protein (TIGR01777 family)
LVPPWDNVKIISQTGAVAEGDTLVLNVPPGVRWKAVHHSRPDGFLDEMEEGPLSKWTHTHRFVADSEHGADGSRCIIHDEVDYVPALASFMIDRRMAKTFAWRRERIINDLSRQVGKPMLRVLLAGASGLIGTQLAAFLRTGGNEVVQLVRRAAGDGQIEWNPGQGQLEASALEGFDAVISLSGENVGEGRWTAARKEALLQSRLGPTALLARTIAQLSRPPKVWIAASAVGIYGDRGDEPVDEHSAAGTGFLADLCQRWEDATDTVDTVRVVKTRLGVVLSARGGALRKLSNATRWCVGGPVGNGQQYFPWIAMDDAVYAMHHLLFEETLRGPVNLVAPNAPRQIEFARALGAALSRPAFTPLPAFAVSLLFGEMGRELLLGGQNVVPTALSRAFTFSRPTLPDVLRAELGTGVVPAPQDESC